MKIKHWAVFIALAMFFFAAVFGIITPEVIAWLLLIAFLAISVASIFSSVKFTNWRIDRK